MDMIRSAFRGFSNLVVSGVLLLLGAALFFGMMQTPADSPSWKANGPFGAAVILCLALFCAFLAYVFFQQSRQRHTWVASFMLNSLASLAFFAVFIMWSIHHF